MSAAVPPLRVAVVIESFNPAAGGNERSTDQILRELVARGHQPTLVTGFAPTGLSSPGPPGEPAHSVVPPGVTLAAMADRKSSSVFRLARFAPWARRQLRAGRFDTSLSVTMAVPARVLQPRGGTVRETLARNLALRSSGLAREKKRLALALDPKQRLLLALERRTLANPLVHRVAALSRYVIRQLEQHYRFPAERTALLPNAAVMPTLTPQETAAHRARVRRDHRLPDHAVVYLMAAQNPVLKGFPTLLAALARLRDAPPGSGSTADPSPGTPARPHPVALLVGGFGPDQQAAADALGLADHVRVVGPARDMSPYFAAADVTVLPTWYDPSSKVVLESLMTATPAISTAYNGASDFIAPPGAPPRGRVVADPGNAQELARAMADLADPAARAACAAACHGLADQLSMTRHVDTLETLLHDARTPR
ncbi:MAG: glycosyltransferase family 4 protein [Planctomycetota bacterium]